MHDDVVAGHGAGQGVEILDVAADDGEPLVASVLLEVPLASRAEVVVYGDRLRLGLREQAVDEVAADEPGSADEEVAAAVGQRTDSQCVPCRWRAGWLTRRCQTTAQSLPCVA